MRNWNKGRWINIVVGILLMTVGSMDKSLVVMFLGFFNLLYVGFYYADKLLNKKDVKSQKSEVKE